MKFKEGKGFLSENLDQMLERREWKTQELFDVISASILLHSPSSLSIFYTNKFKAKIKIKIPKKSAKLVTMGTKTLSGS